MPQTIGIQSAALQEMPNQTIGMICALVALPVHRLPGMVLLGGPVAHMGHFGNGVGEVIQGARTDRVGLASRTVLRELSQLFWPPPGAYGASPN